MLRYFLGIEVAHRADGVVLSQQKYVLVLLTKTGMLGYRHKASPIDPKIKLTELAGEKVDHERYQRLVGWLIYLTYTHPDISFAIIVVSRYMHDLRKDYMDAVY